MGITLRPAGMQDLDTLARLNKQLIEDEKRRNPMGLDGRVAFWEKVGFKPYYIQFRREEG